MSRAAIEQALTSVTEKTAVAAAQTMGYGDERRSEQVAVEAMARQLAQVDLAGRLVIGVHREGQDTLRVGELVGSSDQEARKEETVISADIAVAPLSGPRQCASGAPGAVSVMAASEQGGLLRIAETHMEKIMVGPTARGAVHLDAPVPENLRNIAKAFGREVSDLSVVVLERQRHRQLVADIRETGARIRLISDGDLGAAIAASVRGSGVHVVMGTGGAPEGVLAAAALRCLGGEIQARLKPADDAQKRQLEELGFDDPEKIYTTQELAPGERIVFCYTGVTDGELLRGVRFFGGGMRTSTLLMSLARQQVQFLDTVHREDSRVPIQFH